MSAWVQLNTPVWVSYKQKQREPIIRSGRLQGQVPVAQPEPVWEVLRLTREVQRKHAAGQPPPSSRLFNLITVMSLETVGCTTSNVDADKHAALTHSLHSHWQLNAKRIIRLKPSTARWLIDRRNRLGNGWEQETAIWSRMKQVEGITQGKAKEMMPKVYV